MIFARTGDLRIALPMGGQWEVRMRSALAFHGLRRFGDRRSLDEPEALFQTGVVKSGSDAI